MPSEKVLQQHIEISDYLRTQIFEGNLSPGETLPSEAELCEKFGSSRGPVRQAMSTLRSEGLISSGRGRRSIVLEKIPTQSFEAAISVSSLLKSMGKTAGQLTVLLARQLANAEMAEKLEINERDPYFAVHRLRTADGMPAAIERMAFRADLGNFLTNYDEEVGPLHCHLANSGVDYHSASRILTFAPASVEDADLLGVEEGFPLFLVKVWARTQTRKLIEYSEYLFRTDQVQFGINNVRGQNSPLWMEFTENPACIEE